MIYVYTDLFVHTKLLTIPICIYSCNASIWDIAWHSSGLESRSGSEMVVACIHKDFPQFGLSTRGRGVGMQGSWARNVCFDCGSPRPCTAGVLSDVVLYAPGIGCILDYLKQHCMSSLHMRRIICTSGCITTHMLGCGSSAVLSAAGSCPYNANQQNRSDCNSSKRKSAGYDKTIWTTSQPRKHSGAVRRLVMLASICKARLNMESLNLNPYKLSRVNSKTTRKLHLLK